MLIESALCIISRYHYQSNNTKHVFWSSLTFFDLFETRWLPLIAIKLDPITSLSRVIFLDDKFAFAHFLSLAFLSWKLLLWIFRSIEMWVFSTSPSDLSLIGPLTTEVYYRIGITRNTKTQKHKNTDTHKDWIWYSLHIGYRVE